MLDRNTIKDFHDKEYAHEYMDDFLNTFIATQIKVLREQNGWTQEQLAEEAGMHQERISILENVNHSSWSISTLRKLAKAFDVALRVSFENFSTEMERFSAFTLESIVEKRALGRIKRERDIALIEQSLERADQSVQVGLIEASHSMPETQKHPHLVYLAEGGQSLGAESFSTKPWAQKVPVEVHEKTFNRADNKLPSLVCAQ